MIFMKQRNTLLFALFIITSDLLAQTTCIHLDKLLESNNLIKQTNIYQIWDDYPRANGNLN